MKTQGPSLRIINTCYNCEFFESNLNGVKCNKLETWLFEDYNHYVRPHDSCPFLKSEKETLENKLAEIQKSESESKKLEKLISDIFLGYKFKEKLPDYEFSIDSYDSDTMRITIFKKVKNK